MKICSVCKVEKAPADFYKWARGRDGLTAACRACTLERVKLRATSPTAKEVRRQYLATYKQSAEAVAAYERRKMKCRERYQTDPSYRLRVHERIMRYARLSPRHALRQALDRGLRRHPTDNQVTVDDLMEIYAAQNGLCELSGVKMTWLDGLGRAAATSLSIDRIDCRKGYEPGNVRLICHAVNAFRGNMTDAQMLEMALSIAQHHATKAKSAVNC